MSMSNNDWNGQGLMFTERKSAILQSSYMKADLNYMIV